jgi:Holliday junction DNA helicase RuvA
MIGKLSGIVDSISDDSVILDVGGVGYLVQCPASTLSRLAAGAHAALMIEMKVSDDAIKLYGFATAEEREWFRLLQTVQNVGGKVALSVLSTLSPRDLQRALALSDKAMIGRAPGVGPKLALRIATELKDKAPSMMVGGMMMRGEGDAHVAAARGPAADAVTALVKLGYSEGQAAEAVARAANDLGFEDGGDAAETGTLLREALRGMAR